jgi:5-methylcytosine-specific restriction endonuclease McrA
VYCGKGGRLTMDHIVPLISGGWHDICNIVPACMDCNCKKNKKSLVMFLYERRNNGTKQALRFS